MAAKWFDWTEYAEQTCRPLMSLAFILPLLTLYELGVLMLGPDAMRNGADVWLRRMLDQLGFGQYFLLPILTIGLLLAWHHTTGERWQIARWVLVVMAVECALCATVLLTFGHLQRELAECDLAPKCSTVVLSLPAAPVARVVGFCGAGIYEEVMFRLIMLPPVVWLVGLFVTYQRAIAPAIIATSIMFAAAHYIGVQGESFDWFSFSFRFLAGTLFAILFVYRGFGIAAGTHALYDILVGLS